MRELFGDQAARGLRSSWTSGPAFAGLHPPHEQRHGPAGARRRGSAWATVSDSRWRRSAVGPSSDIEAGGGAAPGRRTTFSGSDSAASGGGFPLSRPATGADDQASTGPTRPRSAASTGCSSSTTCSTSRRTDRQERVGRIGRVGEGDLRAAIPGSGPHRSDRRRPRGSGPRARCASVLLDHVEEQAPQVRVVALAVGGRDLLVEAAVRQGGVDPFPRPGDGTVVQRVEMLGESSAAEENSQSLSASQPFSRQVWSMSAPGASPWTCSPRAGARCLSRPPSVRLEAPSETRRPPASRSPALNRKVQRCRSRAPSSASVSAPASGGSHGVSVCGSVVVSLIVRPFSGVKGCARS